MVKFEIERGFSFLSVYSSIPYDFKGEIERPDLVKNRRGATPS